MPQEERSSEIFAELEASLPDESPADVAKNCRRAAMNLLARREHSVKELDRKLRERFPHTEIRQEALLKLTCEGLQSDRRFSENYWRWRAGKGFGPLRIRQELQQRGVDDSDISHGREEAGIDWHAMIYRQFEKKYDGVAPSSIEEKARYVRFFQYRGFSSDLIRDLF